MCIFCDIVQKKIPSEAVLENEAVLVFRDIHPKAPVHLLIVPKNHIASVNDITEADAASLIAMFLAAPSAAAQAGVGDGYKLAVNVGKKGGQVVEHVHMHLLGWPEGGNTQKEVVTV